MSIVIHQNRNSYYKGTESITNDRTNGAEKKDKEVKALSASTEKSIEVSISEEGYASYSKHLSERVKAGENVNLFSEANDVSEVERFDEDVMERILSIQNDNTNGTNMSYEEKVDFLQKSLKQATELHKIEPGIDIRSKYGYVSTGELMKENDPEFYEKHNKMMTEALEKGDRNLLFQAIRDMLDWQSEFERNSPIFKNYQKFNR
ncbi:MAG: hypothetical protein J1E83_05690 [Lachnospiraceae bacterium]|nr:hypothetical protein [Lachnospiraceae bacterium]